MPKSQPKSQTKVRRVCQKQRVTGLLPAAGCGSRLEPLNYPKELLPIGFFMERGANSVTPKLLIDDSIETFAAAGIEHVCVVISPSKTETIKYLGDGSRHNVSISYRVQTEPHGLAHACSLTDPWYGMGGVTVLALPDTVVRPRAAFRNIVQRVDEVGADLALCVLPSTTPEQLGPVQFDDQFVVTRVWDKPRKPIVGHVWVAAAWSDKFTALLREEVERRPEVILGDVFQLAVSKGLRVVAEYVHDGVSFDLGTPNGISSFMNQQLSG